MRVSRLWFYDTVFVIVQVRCCPTLIVPVAVNGPTFVQSPEKVALTRPGKDLSTIVKVPRPNVTKSPVACPIKIVDG